jgi:hypothetical protein
VQARPLGLDLGLERLSRIDALLRRIDRRQSFLSNSKHWWEPEPADS